MLNLNNLFWNTKAYFATIKNAHFETCSKQGYFAQTFKAFLASLFINFCRASFQITIAYSATTFLKNTLAYSGTIFTNVVDCFSQTFKAFLASLFINFSQASYENT